MVCDIVLGAEDGYQVLRRVRDPEAAQPQKPAVRLPAIALAGYIETSAPAPSEDPVQAFQAT